MCTLGSQGAARAVCKLPGISSLIGSPCYENKVAAFTYGQGYIFSALKDAWAQFTKYLRNFYEPHQVLDLCLLYLWV